ncbi:carbohydrate binding domain-containing protein [Paenibacillus pasadenensis]|uniref:carbohydrate binding domain-containing protein n=1 Tax=Paenibacillus pasadenensis TaxID=217090 RepID=UPI00203C98C1|nr:carbohydrate binding domain-containing protein [Paenibacillus pasadenensis]MCM3748341.1 carbohydrate binding domain-containing protein [Paenibacillus pasadenensis]
MPPKKAFLSFFIIWFIFLNTIPAASAGDNSLNYHYNESNQLIKTESPKGEYVFATDFAYDSNGNLKSKKFRKETRNFLVNGGFEKYTGTNGVADGWRSFDGSGVGGTYEVISSEAPAGAKSQRVAVNGMGAGGYLNVVQDVAIMGNKSYAFNGRIWIKSINNAKFQIVMQYYNSAGTLVGDSVPVELSKATNDWVSISGINTPPSSAVIARIHIHGTATAANASIDFLADSMTITQSTVFNMLSNPGFESNQRLNGVADGWRKFEGSGMAGTFEVATNDAASGIKSQRLAVNGMGTGGYLNVVQDVAVAGNTTYAVNGRVWIKSINRAKFQIVMQYFNNSGALVGEAVPAELTHSTNGWVTVGGAFTTSATAVKARIHIHGTATAANSSIDFLADSITMAKGSTANLLSNSGFEDFLGFNGVADGWRMFYGAGVEGTYEVMTSGVAAGTKSQRIAASGMGAGGYINIVQDIGVLGNTAYTVNGRLSIKSIQNAKFQVVMQYYNAAGEIMEYSFPIEMSQTTNGWINVTGTFTAPVNAVKARIHIHAAASTANASVDFSVDSFSITKN